MKENKKNSLYTIQEFSKSLMKLVDKIKNGYYEYDTWWEDLNLIFNQITNYQQSVKVPKKIRIRKEITISRGTMGFEEK